MKILSLGPYLGNFEEELFTFRPYSRWLFEVIDWDRVYLSTHINRLFLYDFIPEENIIPVYQHFSRDEKNQKGYIHKKVSKKDFSLILKHFRDVIVNIEECNRVDIESHYLSYVKAIQPYSIYNKIFEKIKIENINLSNPNKNKIVFIPSKHEKIEKIIYIYKWLKERYDIKIIGDMNTWLKKDNEILNKIDYFENGWKYIIKQITESKAIICPLSFWTGISNLQNKNVFSWGEFPGPYRENGIYNFGNKKIDIIPSDNETDIKIIIRNIENFLNRLKM